MVRIKKCFCCFLFVVTLVCGLLFLYANQLTLKSAKTSNVVLSNWRTDSDVVIRSKTEKEVWMDEMEKRYSKLSKNIEDVCHKYNKSNATYVNGKRYLVDTYFKWAYCPMGKVGTSTWADHFKKMMTAKERPDRFNETFAKDKWRITQLKPFFEIPDSLKERNNINEETTTKKAFIEFLKDNSLFTFSFIRHPFERIVSAYKDKILYTPHKSWDGLDTHISFPDFIELVIKQHTETMDVNGHWNLLSKNCEHCSIPYDVIGRMETFDEDVEYIILKNGWEHILPLEDIKKVKINTTSRKSNSDKKGESLTYFSKLKKAQIQELYEIYKIDFEMFEYDASDYLLLP